MKAKYIIEADGVSYESNSRNARRHLKDVGAKVVNVYWNNENEELISCALLHNGCVMVGVRK